MGLLKRIRDYVREWFAARNEPSVLETAIAQLGEKRRADQKAEEESLVAATTGLEAQLGNLRSELSAATERRMAWLEVINRIRQVHEEQGKTLASLLEAHGLVGCRLDALAEEICPVVGGSNAAGPVAESADPALQGYTVDGEASDFWQVGTEAATLRWERVRHGSAGGVKVVVVARGWKTVEIPVSAQMALGLIEFLLRAREAAKAGGPGTSAEKRDPIDRIDRTDGKSPP